MNARSLLAKLWRVAYAFGVCIGVGITIRAFQSWEKSGFQIRGRGANSNDGSVLGLIVGVALAAYCLFALVHWNKPNGNGDSN